MIPAVKHLHTRVQQYTARCVSDAIGSSEIYLVEKEFPFRPLPEHEVWIADIAVISADRWENTLDTGYHLGVPAIVMEILSPSNTASEMLDREDICLSNGALEFWLVDPDRSSVRATNAAGHSRVYHLVDSVPLALPGLPPVSLPVQRLLAAKPGERG